jgi:hypothetical protein
MVMEGPLAPWWAGMAERLRTLRYAPSTAAWQLRLVGSLSRFLQERGLAAGELSVGSVRGVLRGPSRTPWVALAYG